MINDDPNSCPQSTNICSNKPISSHNANTSELDLSDSSRKLLLMKSERSPNATECSDVSGSCSETAPGGAENTAESIQLFTSKRLSSKSAPVDTHAVHDHHSRSAMLRSCDEILLCNPVVNRSVIIDCPIFHQFNAHPRRTSGYVSAENDRVCYSNEGENSPSLRYVTTCRGGKSVRPNVLENGEKPSTNEFLIAVENDREQLTCSHSASDQSTPTDFHLWMRKLSC